MVASRRKALGLGLAAALGAPAWPIRGAWAQDAELIRRIEAYFTAIRTLAASFTQIAADGGVATGKLFIDRERQGMRFDYDPPSQILLVAPGDWRVIFYDGSIKQVNVIPLRETPLGFMFQEPVRLAGEVAVAGLDRRGTEIDLALVRTEAPDQGRVVLTFRSDPLTLLRWSVTDAQGLTTRILLDNLRLNEPLDRKLFVWRDPKLFGWPED